MRLLRIFIFSLGVLFISCQNESSLESIIENYEEFTDSQRDEEFPWPKTTSNEIEKQLKFYKEIEVSLASVNKETLSDKDLINFEMLEHIVKDRVYNLSFQSYLIPITSEGGFVTGIIYSLQNRRIKNEEDLIRYLKRLRSLPQYIDQRIENMRSGLESNIKSSKFITSKFLDILDPFIKNQVNAGEIFRNTLESYSGELSEEIEQELNTLISKDIPESLAKLSDFMHNEYYTEAYDKIGAGQLPKGDQYYEQRVEYFTTLEISPEEVFQTGMKEVARIRADMEEIIEELEFEGTWEDFFEFLRTDPQFYAKTPAQLLMRASWICKEMEYEMPKYFSKMPRMPFSVKPVPEAIAPNYTAGRYSGGSYDDHRAGQYWVNTTKLTSRPLYALPALSLHEAVPGHHTQNMLAAEMKDLPQFRRTYLSAFGEGWGLYSEYLGIEAGIYKTPYEHFGRMTYEMWRACRLVVDVGMHYKGWDRQKAFDFMASNTALSIHEVNTEIDRYIGWPAQAVSYKIGELKIRELRERAEEKLGDSFDIRSFHDKVLENGSVPLSTLERIMDQYISEQLNSRDG